MSGQNDNSNGTGETTPTGTPPEGAPNGQPNGESGEPNGEQQPNGTGGEGGEGGNPDPKPEDDLPEWARKELTRARGEAANYRVQLREAQEALQNAKTPEEFEAATATMATRVAELEHAVLVGEVARKFSLPDDLAARLRGATKEELEADAKSLQKYAEKPEPQSLSGGLDPLDDDDIPSDPAELARRFGRGRRRA